MDKIRIKNIQLLAYHGVAQEAQSLGQKFEIDIELHSNLSEAGEQDNLSKTIDYGHIYEIIENEFCKNKYKLLETVAKKISNRLLEIKLVHSLIIKIRIPNAPIYGTFDFVEIEVKRKKI